jgi:hypothetical protein
MVSNLYSWMGRKAKVIARGEPFDRDPRRNVLIEDGETGERVVRPFRGLRRVKT